MGGETTEADGGQRERWQKETMRTGGESARSGPCSESICLRVRCHPGIAQLWEPILAAWAKGPKMGPRGGGSIGRADGGGLE
jgi:hypothetical protein